MSKSRDSMHFIVIMSICWWHVESWVVLGNGKVFKWEASFPALWL